jgi:hypothetical protein
MDRQPLSSTDKKTGARLNTRKTTQNHQLKHNMKMQILNTTTNENETLSYAPTGCDCLADLIAGSLIQYNREQERYEAPATEIEFWSNWIAAAEKADELEAKLAEKLGDKMAASDVSIEAASGVEFNDQPAARIEALQEALNA